MMADQEQLAPGDLANNGMFVQGLQKLLMGSEYNLEVVVRTISNMKGNSFWRAFMRNERVFYYGPSDFRKFIEADRPAGCQTPIHLLEKLLRGTDAWVILQELTRGEAGGIPDGKPHNPEGLGGRAGKTDESLINRDNVTDEQTADEPSRDYSAEAPTGNSVSYALRRLQKNRLDLYERVKDGELTCNAAMIEAGFRDEQLTIPLDPRKAARRIVKHFTHAEFSELVDEALDFYLGENRPRPNRP